MSEISQHGLLCKKGCMMYNKSGRSRRSREHILVHLCCTHSGVSNSQCLAAFYISLLRTWPTKCTQETGSRERCKSSTSRRGSLGLWQHSNLCFRHRVAVLLLVLRRSIGGNAQQRRVGYTRTDVSVTSNRGRAISRTLTANGTEPALRFALASRRRLRRVRLGPQWCTVCDRCRASILPRRRFGSRRGVCLAILVHDVPARAELNHVDCTLAAGDKVAAGQQHDLARGRQTEKTLGGRFFLMRSSGRRGDGRVNVRSGRYGGRRGCCVSGSGRVGRQAVNLVQMERVRANLRTIQHHRRFGGWSCLPSLHA